MKDERKAIVELNVGGSVYTTSRTTLLSCPDSMLARMLESSVAIAVDNQQRLFIDRDGPLFRYILNFLRDKRLNLPERFEEYAQLYAEADFYRIDAIMSIMEHLFHNKLKINVPTAKSLNSNSAESQFTFYYTIISRLHQGSVESIIGSIRVLTSLPCIGSNSRKFISSIVSANEKYIDAFICEFKFMHDEQILCCKPCALSTTTTDTHLTAISQSIHHKAKKYGITTGYWDDMFYLSLASMAPNREALSSFLHQKYSARLLSSSLNEKPSSTYEESQLSTNLIERWSLTADEQK